MILPEGHSYFPSLLIFFIKKKHLSLLKEIKSFYLFVSFIILHSFMCPITTPKDLKGDSFPLLFFLLKKSL